MQAPIQYSASGSVNGGWDGRGGNSASRYSLLQQQQQQQQQISSAAGASPSHQGGDYDDYDDATERRKVGEKLACFTMVSVTLFCLMVVFNVIILGFVISTWQTVQ